MFFTGSGSRQNGKVRIVIVRPHLVATDLRRDTREIPLSSPNVSSSASESELEAADTFPPALEANTRFLQMSTTAAAATKVSRNCMDGQIPCRIQKTLSFIEKIVGGAGLMGGEKAGPAHRIIHLSPLTT